MGQRASGYKAGIIGFPIPGRRLALNWPYFFARPERLIAVTSFHIKGWVNLAL
jgi:hypothetical protein